MRARLLRKLRNVLVSVLALLVMLLATLSALVETESGSRWLVMRIAHLVGANASGIEGNLRTGLDIDVLEYPAEQGFYRVQQLSFRWRPVDLLYGALAIQSLRAQSLLIQLPPTRAPQASTQPFSQWPHLRLPLRIHLQQLRIKNIAVVQGADKQVWETISGSLSWGTFHIRYSNLALVHPDYSLLLTGTTELAFPYKTEASLQWQWQAPAGGANADTALAYMGVSDIDGDLTQLQVATDMGAPVVLSASVATRLVDGNNQLLTLPQLQLVARWQQQTLPVQWWIPNQPVPVTSGELTAQGNWREYRAQLHGDIHLPQAPLLGVSAAVNGDLEKIRIDFLRLRERYLTGAAPANPASSHSSAAPSGDYVDADAGLTLTGDLRWLPHLEWQLRVDATRLNLASVLENWPSNINTGFSTQGKFAGAGQAPPQWNIQLANLAIDGDLRGVNIQGAGALEYDGKQVRSDDLHLVMGANQIQLKGELGDNFNLEWNINAPTLTQLDSRLQGSVVSKGQLRGNLQQPQLVIDANVQQFSWPGYAVEKLQLSLAPTTSPTSTAAPGARANVLETIRQEQYTLGFSASQVRVQGNHFSSLAIKGAGSINRHQLQAVIKHTRYGRLDFNVKGLYEDAEWQGDLEQLALKLKKVPRWWLTSSKPVRISSDRLSLGRQCLTTRTNLTGQVERIAAIEQEQVIGEWMPNQSFVKTNVDWLVKPPALPASPIEKYSLPQLCVEADWARSTGARMDANLDAVPLRQFLSLFKTEVYFAGVMDGSVHITSEDLSLATTQARANIATRNAELRYQFAGGVTEIYPWRNVAVRATLNQAQLLASAGMEWTGYGRVDAETALDLQRQQINRGQLTAQFSNLAPLETLLTYANDVKGDFRCDLSLGGTFSRPQLVGEASLRNGSANLPRLGVNLSNIDIQLNSTQSGNVQLVSRVESGEGRIAITTDVRNLGTPDWTLQGVVKGQDFQLVALPQLKANLSPDISIHANPGTLTLTGGATIPWARANIKSLPESATAVSADAVILDEQFAQAQAEPLTILTNLDLALGEDVRFKGFGLNSKLAGKIKVFKEPQRQFLTSGYVSVVDGSYKAYGQTLTIDRGRLNFQGPYENPGLEIRASRVIRDEGNTKVSLDISGTLQRPKASVSASGRLSERDAMMMLLTGKPVSEASKADASLLVSAMSGLGMDSGGSITNEITKFFRIDELEVKSDQGLDQSELWVGKYLTPKLLVRYVVGIFDQAFSLGMEYQLTDRLRIEAESGETQSVDMVYKIER